MSATNESTEILLGIPCIVRVEQFPDGQRDTYTFTVPGWPQCTVTGRRAAKRVINARLDPAVRWAYGIKD